jgi:hypothetical protein
MNVRSETAAGRSARRRLALGAVLLLVAAGLVTLLLATGGSDGAAGNAAASPSAAGTSTEQASGAPSSGAPSSGAPSSAAPETVVPAAITPEPTGPTADADEGPPSLSAVALDQPAAVGNGITAEVVALEPIDGSAVGPGNVSGPALRATVRIVNGTDAPVALGGVAVDLAYGPELVPASPLGDASALPFSGTVEAGGTAEGVYVFSIAEADRAEITLSVGYEAGAPFLVFTGAAS